MNSNELHFATATAALRAGKLQEWMAAGQPGKSNVTGAAGLRQLVQRLSVELEAPQS